MKKMAEFTIDQIYTACLSQGSYFIQSGTQAAVIDPLREVDAYINLAHERNADIKYIFETHFHADFVSGHLELAEKTDAPIVFGPNAKPSFEAHVAKDGERFCIGDMTLEVLHTPGHTMESVCYLLRSSDGKEVALFSGDTLFLGDVGRPDVSQISGTMTKEILAESLFDSIHTKLTTLSDDVIVYPGHGAGSACGKSMQKETSDTLGNQRMSNYALRKGITKQEFVSEVLDGLSPAPLYFPSNISMNQKGYASLDSIWRTALQPLTPIEFEDLALRMNAVILDTRHGDAFSASFIPGAINIGLDGRFAPWAGAVLADVRAPILVVRLLPASRA